VPTHNYSWSTEYAGQVLIIDLCNLKTSNVEDDTIKAWQQGKIADTLFLGS
jgi:hypothetical protein